MGKRRKSRQTPSPTPLGDTGELYSQASHTAMYQTAPPSTPCTPGVVPQAPNVTPYGQYVQPAWLQSPSQQFLLPPPNFSALGQAQGSPASPAVKSNGSSNFMQEVFARFDSLVG